MIPFMARGMRVACKVLRSLELGRHLHENSNDRALQQAIT